jgi:glycosyltransferase involved in cell wall biosynthesis
MLQAKPIALAVLQVIPALDAGGAERTSVDVARAVVAAGGRAWIATAGGRLESEAESAGAAIVRGPFDAKDPLSIWRNAGVLTRLIAAEKVAIVHARSRAPAWSAWLAARRTGAAFVTTYHGIYNARGVAKRFYNSIMARGGVVIANSRYTGDHVLAEHGIDAKRLRVIPRGIDIASFTPSAVSAARVEAIRKAWGAGSGGPVIVMPGRLTRWKGQLVFVEALGQLENQTFTAVLAGDAQSRDDYVDELRALIDRLGLDQKVRIPGHCSDMPAAYLAADVVVAPSIEPEAFGRVAVEAQAMQRPLVASALGAQTETIVDGVTGFLVPPSDAPKLAAAVARALALTPAQKAEMAEAARANVLAKYTVAAMTNATLAVYRDILAAARAKGG